MDGLKVKVRAGTEIDEDEMKTVVLHYGGQEYVLNVENEGHLMDRLEKFFPDW
jgi:ABC-type phosphonate transport system ATPase subunit